jgi:DNA-binding response OmpR family regulator
MSLSRSLTRTRRHPFQVLVVSADSKRPAAAFDILKSAGHDVVAAFGFDEAVRTLADYSPDLMIAEVRLGAFNGLHLVIRSQLAHPSLRTIVVDRSHDPVLQLDAERLGALYLVAPVPEDDLLAHVSRLRADVAPYRRWPRKELPVGLLVARVARGTVPVIDLSYGGLRLELPDPAAAASGIDVTLPGVGVAIKAKPVWTSPAPSGSFWCGARLSERNPQAVSNWRRLVDSYMTPPTS